jgi:hypothetical protein
MEDVPWNKLWQAYGTAEEVPEILRTLLTGDADARREAQLYISGNVCHQGTRYSSSAAVVPFLIEFLTYPDCPDKDELIGLLLYIAFGLNNLVPPEMIPAPEQLEWERLIDLKGLPFEEVEVRWQQGKLELEDEQVNIFAKLWEWNAYNAVATRAEVFCKFITREFEDSLRMAAIYAVAHFPQLVQASIPLLRAALDVEQNARHCLNLLFALALLDRATNDNNDIQRFQAFFEQDEETLIKLAAAIALATVQGSNVADYVFEHLLDHLECVDQGLYLYPWCLWNKGDLTGVVAKVVRWVGRGREAIALPIVASAVRRILPGPGFQLAYAFLDLMFKREPDGRIRNLAELNSIEEEYLNAFLSSDHYRFWMGYAYGLPKNSNDFRRWGNVWSRL